MSEKNSFVLYTDYRKQFDLLSDADLGRLTRALLNYVEYDQLPELPDGPMMAFSFISAQIDRDAEKYRQTVEKRRAAGSAGGKAKQSNATICKKEIANIANATFANQDIANVADNVNDNVNVNDKKKDTNVSKEKRFAPPTPEAVKEYCEEKGYAVDADRFVDFYASKGWMVGKNHMKDWRAAVRNWAKGPSGQGAGSGVVSGKPTGNKFNQFMQNDYDFDALERELLKGGGDHVHMAGRDP